MSLYNNLFKVSLFLVCFTSFSFAEYSPSVRLDLNTELTLIRLSSRYTIPLPEQFYVQPMSVKAISEFLVKFDSLTIAGKLTKQEMFQINGLKKKVGINDGFIRWNKADDDIHALVHLSLLGNASTSYLDSGSATLKGIISPSLTGNIGNLSFYSGIDVWTDYQSDSLFNREPAGKGTGYQPYYGVPYNLYGRKTGSSNMRSSDLPRGGIKLTGHNYEIETAIDNVKLGPAQFNPLTFSGLTPPLTYAKGRLLLGPAVYTHIVGLLRAQKDKNKYFYAHRIDASLWKSRLTFGLNEVIINGSTADFIDSRDSSNLLRKEYYGLERDWEWVYLIPFVPFKFVEHYAGDRDNAAISFDADLHWPEQCRWYGEFFLDDMLAPWKLFSSDWGNKWAATLGAQYFGVIGDRDISILTEYSHVEPWVYTHFGGASHNFTHFGQSLGAPLGPNSQSIVFKAQSSISKSQIVGLTFNSIAKKSSVRGGAMSDVFQDTIFGSESQDSTKKEFLGNGTVWHNRPGVYYSFNPYGVFTFVAGYELDITAGRGKSLLWIKGGFVF